MHPTKLFRLNVIQRGFQNFPDVSLLEMKTSDYRLVVLLTYG
jgi:hypothetical protein